MKANTARISKRSTRAPVGISITSPAAASHLKNILKLQHKIFDISQEQGKPAQPVDSNT